MNTCNQCKPRSVVVASRYRYAGLAVDKAPLCEYEFTSVFRYADKDVLVLASPNSVSDQRLSAIFASHRERVAGAVVGREVLTPKSGRGTIVATPTTRGQYQVRLRDGRVRQYAWESIKGAL